MADQKYPCVSRLNLPEVYNGFDGFLYAAQLENGLIKFGSSYKPHERARQLQRTWRMPVVAMVAKPIPKNAHRFNTERAMLIGIYRSHQPAQGREYFDDLTLDEAVAFVDAAVRDPFPAGQLLPYLRRVVPKHRATHPAGSQREPATAKEA